MSEHDPQQGSLFDIEETQLPPTTTDPGNYHPRTEVAITPTPEGTYAEVQPEEPAEVGSEADGPSVDVLKRNRTLRQAIGKIASISRATGLSKANQIPGERDRLKARYGDRHEEVISNTTDKSERDAKDVPEDFKKAWGLEEVIASGLASETDAEAEMAEAYRKFEAWYGGSGPGAERREAKKSWLNYQQRTYNGQTTRKPKAEYLRHPHHL